MNILTDLLTPNSQPTRPKQTRGIELKSKREIEIMRESARIVATVLKEISELVEPGMTTMDLDAHAEKRIRDLQDQARTVLMHAQRRWPEAITVHLCPYALKCVEELLQVVPREDGKSPLEVYAGKDHQPALKDFHPFGCPVYVLDKQQQQTGHMPKWKERS